MRIDFGFYVFFKLLSSVSFIFTTPVLLKSLGDEAFGVWSTISTFVTWLILIDFGVGNFLRNKVSELSAKGNIQEIHDSLEKSFHASIFLFFILVVFFGGASLLINWNILLSTKETNLALSVFAIVFFTSLSLVSNLIYFYLFGIQKNYVVAACQLSSQILFIFLVLLFGYLGSLTVFQTALIFGLAQFSRVLFALFDFLHIF